jgi:hypothetical protein
LGGISINLLTRHAQKIRDDPQLIKKNNKTTTYHLDNSAQRSYAGAGQSFHIEVTVRNWFVLKALPQ